MISKFSGECWVTIYTERYINSIGYPTVIGDLPDMDKRIDFFNEISGAIENTDEYLDLEKGQYQCYFTGEVEWSKSYSMDGTEVETEVIIDYITFYKVEEVDYSEAAYDETWRWEIDSDDIDDYTLGSISDWSEVE
jgi:hypothetical protein